MVTKSRTVAAGRFKAQCLAMLDEVSPLATAVGAVNTIVMRDGRWIGTNTDVEGFLEPLKRRLDLRDVRRSPADVADDDVVVAPPRGDRVVRARASTSCRRAAAGPAPVGGGAAHGVALKWTVTSPGSVSIATVRARDVAAMTRGAPRAGHEAEAACRRARGVELDADVERRAGERMAAEAAVAMPRQVGAPATTSRS
jgi:hypothetical protein